MKLVQLMASPFFGGPERQILGLAQALPASYATTFLSFSEGGRCRAFLDQARASGFEGIELKHNFPDMRRSVSEVAGQLRRLRADVLCCNGYKPDLLGWMAAHQTGIPVLSVAHGWTAATAKVRVYETMDRWVMRAMDAVVCVSEGQAVKVRAAGVKPGRIEVIRNAVSLEKFAAPEPAFRAELEKLFRRKPSRIVGAGGRLSPEKGFEVLVDAAVGVLEQDRDAGFVVFGEGPLRSSLQSRIDRLGIGDRFILAGFCGHLERFLPHFDLVALSSYTEGLPVIVLEAFAARTAVVATAVGGVPEVIEDGVNGFLVAPGDVSDLAAKITRLLAEPQRCIEFGLRGRERIEQCFTFSAQVERYERLFERLAGKKTLAGSGRLEFGQAPATGGMPAINPRLI